MALQRYDINVAYRPGSELPVADYLSRNPCEETVEHEFTIANINHLSVADYRLKELQGQQDNDDELKELKRLCRTGWPEDKKQLSELVKPYWPYRDEIHVGFDLVLRSNRILIPERNAARYCANCMRRIVEHRK